ncbi:MAG: hypothetical protein ACRC0V_05970 [Fusobacteriaceae bacterium]
MIKYTQNDRYEESQDELNYIMLRNSELNILNRAYEKYQNNNI